MTGKDQQNHTIPAGGLAALDQVQLNPALEHLFRKAAADCGGPNEWKNRKLFEARELLALSQIAPRFKVIELDLRESFRALAFLSTPVPLRPDENGQLRTASYAMLGITYREAAVIEPQPGFNYVQILQPENLFHPNIACEAGGQVLCLGVSMPAGLRIKELILLTYGALSMQLVMVDPADHAGVLNIEAARWWQVPANLARAPLTREAFLAGGDGYLAKVQEQKA